MKNISFSFYNIVSIFSIILLIVLLVLPFNLINLEQAERIAKWKTDYENLNYCFSLVNLHEGNIIPQAEEIGKIITDEYILDRISPYLNLNGNTLVKLKNYKYKTINGKNISKNNQFYFNKFISMKNGLLLSLKQNTNSTKNRNEPLYYLFVDINGIEKPNRIGQDIFFINIYKEHINALGYGEEYIKLKLNCSPISNGLYCSEYYLLGGRF